MIVTFDFGRLMVEEQELLRIKVKPGWKKGTKITFEGIGDERPGMLPADVIFSIVEQEHPLFKREGNNDLVLALGISLVDALTGCLLSIPLLGGENMNIWINDIIYPGYEKVIAGQGMPIPNEDGKRGNLRIRFRVEFPTKLSEDQRSDLFSLLQDASDASWSPCIMITRLGFFFFPPLWLLTFYTSIVPYTLSGFLNGK